MNNTNTSLGENETGAFRNRMLQKNADPIGVKISKRYIAMILSSKTSDPKMKFHNNPFTRFYVNREQNLRRTHGNIHTDRREFR